MTGCCIKVGSLRHGSVLHQGRLTQTWLNDVPRIIRLTEEILFEWLPPPMVFVKLNFDGYSLDDLGWLRIGGMLRDYFGTMERRYLLKEFPELLSCDEYSIVLEDPFQHFVSIFEVLSSVSPFEGPFFSVQSITQSNVKESKETNLNDLSSLGESKCCIGGVDFVTLIFTLSAVPLHRMPTAIRECFSILKPGGLLLFRDYGLYDMTMLRFEPEKRVGFREYMRSDGTRSYFFCMDTVRDLFTGSGFTELELEYCCVKSTNRRNGKSMHRVWVHGKFQKPF
uniref:Methyltransferase-like protein n=1 Tax=Vitis vinifera TaxID=29760 RepID=A5B297_VITVI|nr:hypothetical protein VITISV_007661 [Vitis vinifera]